MMYHSKTSLVKGYQERRSSLFKQMSSDSKVHGANMGPIWGRQVPGGPHVGPMNFAIWVLVPDDARPSEDIGVTTKLD